MIIFKVKLTAIPRQCLTPAFPPTAALEDSKSALSACVPAVSNKIVQALSESCFSCLKSAQEVPRLYRRTNKVSVIHREELGGREVWI